MDRYDRLMSSLGLLNILIVVQFLLGLYIYFYVSLATGTHSFAFYITQNGVLAGHIILAFVIVVYDFMVFFMAIHARIGNAYIFAVLLSLISIVMAGISGMLFVMEGQNQGASYTMLAFAILALASVGIGMHGTRKAKS